MRGIRQNGHLLNFPFGLVICAFALGPTLRRASFSVSEEPRSQFNVLLSPSKILDNFIFELVFCKLNLMRHLSNLRAEGCLVCGSTVSFHLISPEFRWTHIV